MTAELVAVGFFVGMLVGLTGVGGGSIMTPVLVIVLGINPLVAVGTDLLYSVPTKLYGAYLHGRQGTIDRRIVLQLLYGGVPAAFAGVGVLLWSRHHLDVAIAELWTRRAIGALLLFSAGVIFARPLIARHSPPFEPAALPSWRIAAIGALVGFIVTLTSIGSGSVTLPLLSMALPSIGLARLVGSDIAFAALLIPTAAAGRWSMGDVNVGIAITLLAGSLPGIFVGSMLCARLESQWLRPAVAVTLVFVGSRLI